MTTHEHAMCSARQPRIAAILGLGEVGCVFAQALSAAGLRVHGLEIRRNPSLEAWASDTGIELHDAPGVWLRDADIVISSVTGSVAVAVASTVTDHLRSGSVYLDVNTATPGTMAELEELLRPRGVAIVDGAIMGSLQLHGAQVPLLLTGGEAESLAAQLSSLGFRAQAREGRVGDASAIKMLRSVFMKGLEALAVECMTAAHRLDLRPAVVEALADLDERPIAAVLDMLLTSHLRHAVRRGKEVDEVQGLLRECGLPPVMTAAAGTVFATTIRHLAEKPLPFGRDLDSALSWLARAAEASGDVPHAHYKHTEGV